MSNQTWAKWYHYKHNISTSWKKTLDGGPYMFSIFFFFIFVLYFCNVNFKAIIFVIIAVTLLLWLRLRIFMSSIFYVFKWFITRFAYIHSYFFFCFFFVFVHLFVFHLLVTILFLYHLNMSIHCMWHVYGLAFAFHSIPYMNTLHAVMKLLKPLFTIFKFYRRTLA